MAGSTGHIVKSLVANAIIAVAKGVAAAITGSGAMLAEAIHSGADCTNQALLLLGVRQSRKPPDATHPLGYGRELYFWSFMVAMLLFTGGGAFSIYEGIHKLGAPEPIENPAVGLGVLGFALAIEGWATFDNIRELNVRRKGKPFIRYLRETKDSDLVVVFGENSAATIGLLCAAIAVLVAWQTNDPMWDAVGTLVVGVILVLVAVFLAVEVKGLLVGEAADAEIERTLREIAGADPDVQEVLRVLTIQQGPGEVVVATKLRIKASLSAAEVVATLNRIEAQLKARQPEVRWIFAEPDHDA